MKKGSQRGSFRMINVGVIGVGSEWEKYRPILYTLRRPVGVLAVYDAVHARAEQVAASLSTTAVTGVSRLARRHDIHAVLLLESSWATASIVDIVSRYGKPVFIRPWLTAHASYFEANFERASQAGLMLMPAMWRRFMPSAIRMQELFATHLGKPLRVSFRLELPDWPDSDSERVVGWLDFSRNLFRAYPHEARLDVVDENTIRMTIEYPATDLSQQVRQAALSISAAGCNVEQLRDRLRESVLCQSAAGRGRAISTGNPAANPDGEDFRIAQVDFECEAGHATIFSRTNLHWQLHDDSTATRTEEELSSERAEQLVMLDLFCRRLAGGLIPVADFSDISRALRLVELVL